MKLTICLMCVGLSAITLKAEDGQVRTKGAELGEWTQDVEAARELARKSGKYLFMNFTGSDWCGWCKLMDEHVFSQPGWIAFARENLALAFVDTPKDASRVPEEYRERNKALKREYGIKGFPTFLVFGPDGHFAGKTGAINHGNEYNFVTNVTAVFVEDSMAELVGEDDFKKYREALAEKAEWDAKMDALHREFQAKYATPRELALKEIDAIKLDVLGKAAKAMPRNGNEFAKDAKIVFSDFGAGVVTNGAAFGAWTTDLPAAQALAKKSGKDILLAFTGTNWCKWGNDMEKAVFNTVEWMEFAKENLVLVYVDCPDEAGEAKLPEWLVEHNAELYKAYGLRGCPMYLLVDENGKKYDEFGADSSATSAEQVEAVRMLLAKRRLRELASDEDVRRYEEAVKRERELGAEWRKKYDEFVNEVDGRIEEFKPIAEKRDTIFEKALKRYWEKRSQDML